MVAGVRVVAGIVQAVVWWRAGAGVCEQAADSSAVQASKEHVQVAVRVQAVVRKTAAGVNRPRQQAAV